VPAAPLAQVCTKPCGTIVDISELINSEGVSQVYATLVTLTAVTGWRPTTTVYDAACLLGKYASNKSRAFLPTTTTACRNFLCSFNPRCDRFHVKNHVNPECQAGGIYHPDSARDLDGVNTERAEQVMLWLNKGKVMYRKMRGDIALTWLLVSAWSRNDSSERPPRGTAPPPAPPPRFSDLFKATQIKEAEHLGLVARNGDSVKETEKRIAEAWKEKGWAGKPMDRLPA